MQNQKMNLEVGKKTEKKVRILVAGKKSTSVFNKVAASPVQAVEGGCACVWAF